MIWLRNYNRINIGIGLTTDIKYVNIDKLGLNYDLEKVL